MAVTDYKFAGTAANVDRDGKGDWSDVDNSKADDSNYATNYNGKNTYGDWLRLTNFGFTVSDIPSGSTINGIEFIVGRYAAAAAIHDSAIYLRKTSGQTGSNMASATGWPTGSPAEATYGGSTNMCGTSLTQSDIVSTDFGIDLSTFNDNSSALFAYVDYIKIRVYYTEGGGATVKPHYYYLQQ
jgi:hypothetical protein